MLQRRKKVLVGMSGGVDSSVAACLLLDRGYEVVGVHMKYWADEAESGKKNAVTNKCCTVESTMKAIFVCKKLKIPLLFVDFRKEFKKEVVDHYLSATAKGLTPNACVECNRTVKFGLFMEKMKELGADFVATGHYARVLKRGSGKNARYALLAGKDKDKDQSYFLYTLTQEKLKHIIFPLGNLLKSAVRKLAAKYGLEDLNEQKESQNLCFLPDGSREEFLQRHLGIKKMRPGPIIDLTGKLLGKHRGLPAYTIGQRKGICIGGGPPLFVVGTDSRKNALIVGAKGDLNEKNAVLDHVTFVADRPPLKASPVSGGAPRATLIKAKIRYRHTASPAILKIVSGKKMRAEITFKSSQRAVTPGQSVVFYRGEEVLGGGVIT